MKTLSLIPRVSEKAYGLSTLRNTYVFIVPMKANKIEIGKAVEAQFEVKVTKVNTVRQIGKTKRAMTSKRRSVMAERSDMKRAYVTLAPEFTLPIFANLEEATPPAPEAEKKSKTTSRIKESK